MKSRYPTFKLKDAMLSYARELAETGGYADWGAILPPLAKRYGDEQSARLLNGAAVHEKLDLTCKRAAGANRGEIPRRSHRNHGRR